MGFKSSSVLLCVASILCTVGPCSAASNEIQVFHGAVLQASPSNDGDSFRVNLGDRVYVLRLYFVDCPESSAGSGMDARRVREQTRYFGLPDAKQTLAFGRQAAAFTAEALRTPFTVYTAFASAPGRSSGGRYYAFVVTSDGRDLATQLVRHGLARSYGLGRGTPGGVSRDETKSRLNDLEIAAMIKGVGIWSQSDPERIVDLRAEQRREDAELAKIQQQASNPEHQAPLDLNHATVEELQLLKGVGPVRAGLIIQARPFEAVEDLLRVKGIGKKTLERLRPQLNVGKHRNRSKTTPAPDPASDEKSE